MNKLLEKYFSVIKGFLPEKSSESSLGLDIGENSCKIVELNKSGDSFEILNWAIEPIKDGNVKESVQAALAKVNSSSAIPYSGVFGKGTLIRYLDMPKMQINELRSSFELESDKYFPFPAEQIYTDCYILDSGIQDKKMSVLVAAAKKEIINERVDLLTSLGLQTSFIGVNPIAIANVFYALGKSKPKSDAAGAENGAVAVLDMGENVSNLIILKDNLPRFTRDIYIGGMEMDKRIANLLGVSIEQAEEIKCQPGEKSEDILSVCESALSHLASEIRLSFDYFITEKNIPVPKLYLTGGASCLAGVPEFFAKNLDLPVERWNPLSAFKLGAGVSTENLNKNVNKLTVAVGLALYHYD